MAKRYSVASPSTGTGGSKVLYAGGGARSRGIPKSAPGGFSIDLGFDKMKEMGEDDEKRKYLVEGGLDPKAVALMDTNSLNMGVRAMSDDLIKAEEKKGEVEYSKELAEFIKGSKSIPTGREAGDIMAPPGEEDEALTEAKEVWGLGDLGTIGTPDYGTMSSQGELLERFMGLSPRAATEPRAISAYETANKRLTPKEVDPWTHSASMMVGDDHVTFDKDGKELRRINLPTDTDWQEVKGWLGDKQGSFFRDKDNPNVYIMDGKEPKFHPVPEGFSRVRPRSEKSLSMKFNAFLETNKDYKEIVETHKVNGKKVLLDPKDLYINGSGPEQAAAIEFFNTRDGTVALIEAITELQKTRNKGDNARRTKIDALIKQREGR